MSDAAKTPESAPQGEKFYKRKKGLLLFIFSFIVLAGVAGGAFYKIKLSAQHEKPHSDPSENAETHSEAKSENHGDAHGKTDEQTPIEEHAPHSEKPEHSEHEEQIKYGSLLSPKTYIQAISQVEKKAFKIKTALEENQKLKIENAALRQWAEEIKFSCTQKKSLELTESISERLKKDTGTELGKVLASINYTPPSHLLPSQLLTLGLTYFRTSDYEKSAVIMTFLTQNHSEHIYKNSKYFLVTAMSWYFLKNYTLAIEFFNKSLQSEAIVNGIEQFKAQAHLGLMFAYNKLGNSKDAQYWARQLVFNYPFSKEAQWINSNKENTAPSVEVLHRVPASKHDQGHAPSDPQVEKKETHHE